MPRLSVMRRAITWSRLAVTQKVTWSGITLASSPRSQPLGSSAPEWINSVLQSDVLNMEYQSTNILICSEIKLFHEPLVLRGSVYFLLVGRTNGKPNYNARCSLVNTRNFEYAFFGFISQYLFST
jgi:hypothetical protein